MTKEEALLHYQDSEDIEESWEDRFLAHLNFFRTKVPVPSLFRSRLLKLKKDFEAADILIGLPISKEVEPRVQPAFEQNGLSNILVYHEAVRDMMKELFTHPTPEKTSYLVEWYLTCAERYLKALDLESLLSNGKTILLSEIPEQIELINAVKGQQMKGSKVLSELNTDNEEVLIHELRRLALLKTKFEK